MYTKIQITGQIEAVTGMHIGGNSAFAAIGAVDSPVVKDSRTNLPMLPGSSLKGKMRSLLAKVYNTRVVNPDEDHERVRRVFGSAQKGAGKSKPSRILVSDMLLANEKELRDRAVNSLTEVKFENSINRQTAVANPRQIERVIPGAKFDLDIIYEAGPEEELQEDIELLAEGFRLLQYDYIGGHGSRGYGKIRFTDLHAEVVVGGMEEALLDELNAILAKV
ncbi:MAG: type III-A CRISPR-associated RAMP protein Csm3 [Lachnospiraceae bacterium]|nr:type III-A CRISPR-associated RAMP protein Csm3 [Lachnospiraceae bacterium]